MEYDVFDWMSDEASLADQLRSQGYVTNYNAYREEGKYRPPVKVMLFDFQLIELSSHYDVMIIVRDGVRKVYLDVKGRRFNQR